MIMTRTSTFIIAIFFGIGFAQAALPDPFVITWELAQSSFYVSGVGGVGYAFDNDVGYLFANGFNTPQNSRYNFTDGTVITYPVIDDPSNIQRPCVVPLPNGDIYVIGGSPDWNYGNEYQDHLYQVYKLAAGANNYTLRARLTVGRHSHTCAYDATTNRIYAIGGVSVTTVSDAEVYQILYSSEYYSIDHNNWTVVTADLPLSNLFVATVLVDGNIYLFNGIMSGNSQVILRYNIANNTWANLGPTNKPNHGQIAAFYQEENIILLFGGNNATNDGCEYFNLTSQQMVPFTCNTTNSSTIGTGAYYNQYLGTFIPSTRTLYAVNPNGALVWTATIPLPFVPEPLSEPVSSTPEPIVDAPPTSRPNPAKIVAEGVRRMGLTIAVMSSVMALVL